MAIDGAAFRRIERRTHFLCDRKADRASPRLLAFRQWLLAELGVASGP